ncbi:UNVERIFIED_CONTAM: hypothetical protein GTU68_061715 [Idotea baltica]|nr:hypothetical protein [Idotea baltica]
MGALHKGHISLINHCQQHVDITIVSIFVNPTQFNDPKDLDRYPRKDSDDIAILKKQKVDALFFPSVEEMYPEGTTPKKAYDFGALATVMEGAHRKGHFEGVAQVVNLLLNYIQPHQLFMGQKDFQQVAIIRKLIEIEDKQIELIACPTVREEDGLAMSSRNALLLETERLQAPKIREALLQLKASVNNKNLEAVIKEAITLIETNTDMTVEYLEAADTKTLAKAEDWQSFQQVVICTAVHLGKVRLIDNILI